MKVKSIRFKGITNEGLPANFRVFIFKNAIEIDKSTLSYGTFSLNGKSRKFKDKYYATEKIVLKQKTLIEITQVLLETMKGDFPV